MKQSQLFTKTEKHALQESISKNYELLVKGGFIHQEMAGVYTFLPLGERVLEKIKNIVREEMNLVGGQEVLMPALHPQKNWEKTGRWNDLDVLFKVPSQHGSSYALGASHEEIVAPLAKLFVHSYKDLPLLDIENGIWSRNVYQIQTKFRDEKRAKSGLLRGREFIMKDLYSFHQTSEDLELYYNEVSRAYTKIFTRFSLDSILTEASGGSFAKFSHEFQVVCTSGEDTIYYCSRCKLARNKELIDENQKEVLCAHCNGKTEKLKAAEVGNIFLLKTKYSDPFELTYKDERGEEQLVYMGCYGIGISRLMGVVVEVHNDASGIIWPSSLAPFGAHLLVLGENQTVRKKADTVYQKLLQAGIEVLYDDRTSTSPGEKFADADIIGCPYRLVASERSGEKMEVKRRDKKESELVGTEEVIKLISL